RRKRDRATRRLEALRHAGIFEPIDADEWRIPDDLVSRAAAYGGRDRQGSVRVLSLVDLPKPIDSDGATRLDLRLTQGEAAERAPAGFGRQVRQQRREHLVDRAAPTGSGTADSSTGAAFSPPCTSARSPASARRWCRARSAVLPRHGRRERQ